MITEAVREVCEMCEYTEGIQVCISIPGGEEVAKKNVQSKTWDRRWLVGAWHKRNCRADE